MKIYDKSALEKYTKKYVLLILNRLNKQHTFVLNTRLWAPEKLLLAKIDRFSQFVLGADFAIQNFATNLTEAYLQIVNFN